MNSTVIKFDANQFTIVRGEQREMFVALILSNQDFVSFDLAGRSDIECKLPGTDSGILTLSETGGEIVVNNESAGQLTITIDEDNSNALRVGQSMNFQINVLYPAKGPRKAYFKNRLNVINDIAC
jgi:hypothetical protein